MEKYLLLLILQAVIAAPQCRAETKPAELRYKDEFLRRLVEAVPQMLSAQDPQTGRFGHGIWIVGDQHPIYPLAVAWATESPDNPYYRNEDVLRAVVAGGDALIADMDETGQWEFRKKDGSTWGKIYMPWTYSRWIRAYGLVRDGMTAQERKRWEDALTLGYTGIANTQLEHVHNIPAHHAMGLYIAGRVLDRPEWCEQASEFLRRVAEEQDPGGFWSEHVGPVVSYNFVYSDALGIYYALSRDERVLPALQRAARFHANFTYPDGSKVETVDERNPYHSGVSLGNVGFSFTPEGRGYLTQQLERLEQAGGGVGADAAADFFLYGDEGLTMPTAAADRDRTFVSADGKALIRRKGPWFICLSAYHCPIPETRWQQDRQNLVSIFQDRCGLILGGGNTKLQPLWSNFTVGDISLLQHKAGDTSPKFTPEGPLFHVPSAAGIKESDPPGLGLRYGEERCAIEVEPVDDHLLRIYLRAAASGRAPVEAHVTLIPHSGKPFRTERMAQRALGDEEFVLSSEEAGKWIAHSGWKLSLPDGSRVQWPVLPHNPYRKDGAATAEEGRIVVSMPFSPERQEYVLTLTVEE